MRECQKIVEMLKELGVKAGGRETDEFMELSQALDTLVPPGIYEHFKSTKTNQKLYSVLGISGSTEYPGEYVVVYASCYGRFDGKIAHRPLLGSNGFLVPVKNRDGYSGPRFIFQHGMSRVDAAASFQ